MATNQIQILLCSLTNLFDIEVWQDMFNQLEEAMGTKLTHLDVNDPIRKKVSTIEEAAKYICDIGNKENSRTVFAKFQKLDVEMTITLFRENTKSANSISIYFPNRIAGDCAGLAMINDIFVLTIKKTNAFYALCDMVSSISGKRKLSGFAVNLQAELIGVFWLTYFNNNYVEYIGASRFSELECQKADELSGILVKLGRSPAVLRVSRDDAERILGEMSFVDPTNGDEKLIGKHALTFDLLKVENFSV